MLLLAPATPPNGVEGRANAKLVLVKKSGWRRDMAKKKMALLESVPALVLLGLLAGAVGGLGIGLIQLKSASSSSASAGK
jgi:hypothetical protein